MRIKKIVLIATLLLMITSNLVSQVNDGAIRQKVLAQGIVDSLYVFGEWKAMEETETHLKYLGTLETENGIYKIMTSTWLWGTNTRRATNRLLVFDVEDKYLGEYNSFSMICDLPNKIEKNELMFSTPRCDSCDKNRIIRIPFEENLLEMFFVECKGDYGNIYVFEKVN